MDEAAIANLHAPVLANEVIDALATVDDGRYLDGTLGMGGHASAILQKTEKSHILGLDQDREAIELARLRLKNFGERAILLGGNFANFDDAMRVAGWDSLDGAILDLGVSSFQLDRAERGFSFNDAGPLDMRMDRDGSGKRAWEIVNRSRFEELRDIIRDYGEDPQAGRIARFIAEERQKASIEDTRRLAEIVCRAYPKEWRRRARRHPATRTFQAIRMVVNDELGKLNQFLDKILPFLKPGGRLAIISFHSLEDRMVKRRFRTWSSGCVCPKNTPACVCGHRPEVLLPNKKPIVASESEISRNPRASSAKLRVAQKMAEESR